MNNVTTKQNEEYYIDLLKAQRVAYSQCKSYQVFDVISIIIAIVFPLLSLIYPELLNPTVAFGVLWTIAYLVTEGYRKNKTIQGATIQEQFDTELYDMDWNEVLCNNKIAIDFQKELAKKYKKNDLENWYSIEVDSSLPTSIAIILCQRINFSWEIKQRKKFVAFLTILISVYYFIFISLGLINNTGFYNLLLILSPSVSFLIYGVLNILSLNRHIKSKRKTLTLIDNRLDNYKTERSLPSNGILRQIQDVIFNERTVPEKVPDWFYEMNKEYNEKFIDELIIKIKKNL